VAVTEHEHNVLRWLMCEDTAISLLCDHDHLTTLTGKLRMYGSEDLLKQ